MFEKVLLQAKVISGYAVQLICYLSKIQIQIKRANTYLIHAHVVCLFRLNRFICPRVRSCAAICTKQIISPIRILKQSASSRTSDTNAAAPALMNEKRKKKLRENRRNRERRIRCRRWHKYFKTNKDSPGKTYI